jgi:hypothetical protein
MDSLFYFFLFSSGLQQFFSEQQELFAVSSRKRFFKKLQMENICFVPVDLQSGQVNFLFSLSSKVVVTGNFFPQALHA